MYIYGQNISRLAIKRGASSSTNRGGSLLCYFLISKEDGYKQ